MVGDSAEHCDLVSSPSESDAGVGRALDCIPGDGIWVQYMRDVYGQTARKRQRGASGVRAEAVLAGDVSSSGSRIDASRTDC